MAKGTSGGKGSPKGGKAVPPTNSTPKKGAKTTPPPKTGGPTAGRK